jgi:hypothetical protein
MHSFVNACTKLEIACLPLYVSGSFTCLLKHHRIRTHAHIARSCQTSCVGLQDSLIVDMLSPMLHPALVARLQQAALREAARLCPQAQVLPVVAFIRTFLDTNLLAPAFGDLNLLREAFDGTRCQVSHTASLCVSLSLLSAHGRCSYKAGGRQAGHAGQASQKETGQARFARALPMWGAGPSPSAYPLALCCDREHL